MATETLKQLTEDEYYDLIKKGSYEADIALRAWQEENTLERRVERIESMVKEILELTRANNAPRTEDTRPA